MADTKALLGALLGRGMTESSSRRVEHSLGEEGGLGGILESLGLAPAKQPVGAERSGAPSRGAQRSGAESMGAEYGAPAASTGSPLDALAGVAKSIFGEGERGGGGGAVAAGGLGALLGSILGGGGKSAKGALGGGALALLGAIALKALRGVQDKNQASAIRPEDISDEERLAAGLRQAATPQEEKQVASIADLTVKAMLNAAKADGRIDEDEMQKVVGELQADGITDAERQYVMNEIRKPQDTAALVRAVPNQQVAAQLYAASLLAIEVDTPAEKAYLQSLARDLRLDNRVVQQIHHSLGMA